MISYKYINNLYTESVIINQKDILYNKDKFDKSEINLCFITGHSGGGKSSMARNMVNDKTEMYELDDLVWNKMKFSMDDMKKYGDLFYSFFNGIGKKYYYTEDDAKEGKVKPVGDNYEELIINDFVKYAMNYVSSHKNKKYVIEGVWLVDFCKPEMFKDYAFYIKGTSLLVSRWRAAKRDSKDAPKGKRLFERIHNFTSLKLWKPNYDFERDLMKFRKYFSNLMKEEDKPKVQIKQVTPTSNKTKEDDEYSVLNDKYLMNKVTESVSNNMGLSSKEIDDIIAIKKSLSSEDKKNLNMTSYKDYKTTGSKCFIEYDNNTPVAYSIVDIDKNNDADLSVACNPNYRGKGFAYKVLKKAVEYAKSHANTIYYATKANNIASQKLAKKVGLTKVVRDDKEWKTFSI